MALTQPTSEPLSISVSSLSTGRKGISPSYGACIGEAASVCIANAKHPKPVCFKVNGFKEVDANFDWNPPSEQAFNTWKDEEYTTEQAAYGIAVLLVEEFGLEVVERSRKGTGFDFWLGTRGKESELFQNRARLEVSGIRIGNEAQIKQRSKIKFNQTKKSDNLALSAVVAIIEFSSPKALILER